MNGARWKEVERVVDVALDSDPELWPGILEERCRGDVELRREVEALLDRYHSARRYLDSPPVAAAAALVQEARGASYTREGSRVGAYRIVRQIGRGGMALVFLAERDDGEFTQQVALKLLRPGHDSEIDQGRFRAERQILASLSHPNIARLLDGGVTDDGLPYLVMEVVEGEPIDRYYDARSLPVRKRLEMFLTVIEATHYAHRNLVVHRDLKPSNILVTNDGQVKLLDFGLAKMLAPATPDTGLTTQRWMTPEYAAPEQVRSEPATTLTDVYQLGVVLYQLLTGRLPFGTRHQSPHELERAILEQEPPVPSSPDRGDLRGDLDAIVLKALEKTPEERYASAEAFADDVRRYLAGHPVLARPQTAAYRARRFARRHRWALAASAVGVIVIVAYAVTVTVQRARVAQALAQATVEAEKLEQVSSLLLELFETDEPGTTFADTVTARQLLNRGLVRMRELVGQPAAHAQMLDVVGQLYAQLGDSTRARGALELALTTRRETFGNNHADVAATLHHLAEVVHRAGSVARAIALRREALAIRRGALGPAHPLTLQTMYSLETALREAGDSAAARRLHEEWVAAVSARPWQMSPALATQLFDLGWMLHTRWDLDGAERLYRQVLAMRRTIFGARHTAVGEILHYLGVVVRDKGDLEESERLLREAVAVLRAAPPSPHYHAYLVNTLASLGITLQRMQRWDEAVAIHEQVEAMVRDRHGEGGTFMATAKEDLGELHRQRGAYERAEPYLRDALRVYSARWGDDNLRTMRTRIELGDVLRARGAYAEAERLLLEGYAGVRDRDVSRVDGDPKNVALVSLVKLYEAQGRESEAAKYRVLIDSVSHSPRR